jgi:hypothetical protein
MHPVSTLQQSKQGRMNTKPWRHLEKQVTYRFTISIETNRFTTLGMAHLLQNGCLPGVGVTDDQDSKVLNILLEY